jgi:stearoyl-CoA desaturase (delta-9 desaturase)
MEGEPLVEPLPQYPYRQSMLNAPTYGHVGPNPHRPTFKAVWTEWFDAINCFKDRSRLIPAAYALYHIVTGGVFFQFVVWHFSFAHLLSVAGIATAIGSVYNTIWYHRYRSHQAFRFRNLGFARAFLWTNPISLREESYVIPHRIHHSRSDEPGDPYGPHLGWLGSYLATETQQKTNRDLSREEHDRLVRSLAHTGIHPGNYEQYRRTGSVESEVYYAARVVAANLLWSAVGFALGGRPGILAYFSGVFLFTFLVRDFNFRGHSSLVGGRKRGMPVNHFVYGLIAGEWHENHHAHPRLARSGFAWWQVDIPYYLICLMRLCGIIADCHSRLPETKAAAER